MMTTTPIENHTLERLLDAWDTTVLPTHRDGAMQEWMEALRHEFTTCPDASITGRITGRITGLDPAPKAETDDRHAQELLAQDMTIARALLEQVLEALDNIPHPPWRDKELADAIRAELAKPVDITTEMAAVADRFAHKLALDLECVLADYSGTWYDTAMTTLGAYRKAMNAIHERESPTFMGEPVLLDIAAPTPAWHDAPEVAALKAERDALLELLVFAASTIKSEYPESQWDEYRIPEIDAAIAKVES